MARPADSTQEKPAVTPPGAGSLDMLLKATDLLREAVRSYDTRSQIASAGYLLTLGVMRFIWLARPSPIEVPPTWLQILSLAVLLLPVALFGYVLLPWYRINARPLPSHKARHPGTTFTWLEGRDATEIDRDMASVDWIRELSFEAEKLSQIRDAKRQRFIAALVTSTISLFYLAWRLCVT